MGSLDGCSNPRGEGGVAGTKRVWGKESTFATVSSLCFLGDGAVGGGASGPSSPKDPHGISRPLAHRAVLAASCASPRGTGTCPIPPFPHGFGADSGT